MAVPGSSSILSRDVAAAAGPYLEALCIRNGYRFFVPNPGPNHVVRYELIGRQEDATGDARGGGVFPDIKDRQRRWWPPRLLYHRRFMLSEQAVFGLIPEWDERFTTDPPPGYRFPSDEARQQYKQQRSEYWERFDHAAGVLESIARRLISENDAQGVILYLGTRRLPGREEIAAGKTLDDENIYSEIKLGQRTAGGVWQWSERFRGNRVELLP